MNTLDANCFDCGAPITEALGTTSDDGNTRCWLHHFGYLLDHPRAGGSPATSGTPPASLRADEPPAQAQENP